MFENTVLTLYLIVMGLVCVYGVHRYFLVFLYYRHRRRRPELKACFREWPMVTVQLPMYNEQFVAERIIDYACRLDYPRDRLEIQVLDDSTDSTVNIAQAAVTRHQAQGVRIVYIHRDNRKGYKAGALEAGLRQANGEFVAIFDADFMPPPHILKEAVQHFTDAGVGMVQARWDHANRNHSLLTKMQSILLDGHFIIEHVARNRSGRFMSFNGTAGIWRRSCIEDAGGWGYDTLTEDLDLSYRAQIKGWRFVYLPELTAPAELPAEMNAFKTQQYRWTKGFAQNIVKLLPTILRAKLPWWIKLEAFFHMTYALLYFCIVAITLLLCPILVMDIHLFGESVIGRFLFDFSLFVLATCSASTFYICCQRELFRDWADSVKYLPFMMSLGIGISVSNCIAALSGLFGKESEFVRTPKIGELPSGEDQHRLTASFRPAKKWWVVPAVEVGLGTYMLGLIVYCLQAGNPMALPFLALFAVGYLYVGLTSIAGHLATFRAAAPRQTPEPQPIPSGSRR